MKEAKKREKKRHCGKRKENWPVEKKKISPAFSLGYEWDLNFPYRFGKFLCLTADVFPPGDPQDHRDKLKDDDFPIPSKNVRFMVDSGSDIVTLSDHVIEELKLPVIGRCQQEVAGGDIRDVSLYSACLGIGKRRLNITVRLRWKSQRTTKRKTICCQVTSSRPCWLSPSKDGSGRCPKLILRQFLFYCKICLWLLKSALIDHNPSKPRP